MIPSRRNLIGTLVAAIVLAGTFLGARVATAQPVFTTDPCGNVSIINNLRCPITLNFDTYPAGVWAGVVVPPMVALLQPVPYPFELRGVNSLISPTPYQFTSPAVANCIECGPTDWFIQNLSVGTDPSCCYTICVNPCTCTITFNPASDPTNCRQ
jgi:hypothetical protein